MQFICDKNIILKEISVAHEIIASRNAISILSNVLLEAEGDTLTIRATDLKISSFETHIPAQVSTSGSTTVFCDKFLGILRSLPDGDVEFSQGEDNKLKIVSGSNISFSLHSIAADKFPETPASNDSSFFTIAQKDFIEMISQTAFAVSDDETRYYLNGLYMEKDEDKLVMVATDGRRLSYISKNLETSIPDFTGIIVPPKVLNLVRKLSSGQGELQLAIQEKTLFIKFDNQKVTSSLLDGQFPNYSMVIPKDQENEIKVNREEFFDAIKRVSLLAENSSKRIFLSAHAGKMKLYSEEVEIGLAENELPCQYNGPECTFSLNYAYLSDPLKAIESEEVNLKFTDVNRAMTLVSVPEQTFFHIIMPINKG